MRTPTVLAVVATSAVALFAAACTSSGSPAPSTPAAAPTTPAATSAKPAPKPKPTHHARPKKHVPAVNPLTGIGRVPHAPLIAVKIDDTAPGRPQVGIDKADVVYIEAAEGGLTRLAALYGTNKPVVGYVRSTRPSDPDLLLQYGKITEAYSGGAHDSLPRVHRSGITSWSNDAGAPFYRRVSRSASSYINLVLNLRNVARHTHSPRPRSNGWTFGRLKGIHTSPAYDIRTTVTGSYSSGTPVEFKYDRKIHKYVRYIGGVRQRAADGRLVAARNVIVQSCRILAHRRDTDVLGNPSQFTYTTGHGGLQVFRYGKRIKGAWTRSNLHRGTIMRALNGRRIPLAPGNTWVVLIRKGIPVSS